MKITQINTTCGAGSTGKICVAVSDLLSQASVENHILYTAGHSNHPAGIKYMPALEAKLQALKSRVFGNYGFQSKQATKRLVAELERIAPDIVHLHNLHGHNVHLGILFSYLKEKHLKIFWTFHDCWAFTGYCPLYDMVGCSKWQTSCRNCPQRSHYSWFFDRSAILYEKKKQLFSGLDLTIITPSQWLADQVKQSFLKDYPVKVIHNGIDPQIFRPTDSDFRQRYHCQDQFLLLGVAFDWNHSKGPDVFMELSKRLPEQFRIVLVGVTEELEKTLPETVIAIRRTSSAAELAQIYSAADLFVNPTREDTFPTVNMEALACGTPVLTFRTGGSPEIPDESCGCVVEVDDLDALEQQILRIAKQTPYSREACLQRAACFHKDDRYREYIELYQQLTGADASGA
jgi:glycosyltransferase involved in cell wall biosynthesis